MGHKVHPKIHRTQVIYTWDSRWFSKKKYPQYVEEDLAIRGHLMKVCKEALIDSMSVERGPKNVTVTILASKPGVIIGRSGQGLDGLRKHIEKKILKMASKVTINVREVKNPALSAAIVAQTIVSDIQRRIPFRRVMKQSIERVKKAGALGVKIRLSGRLNGVEIARSEAMTAGKVPLITLRSDVDYYLAEAHTLYGKIGVKVWIYKGEIFGRKDKFNEEEPAQAAPKTKRG
ncbi:MAG: 30S ribosomal protein S3 [Candidatus Magasanikbacteria bacterium RIFCSPHIGHO2_02_FULL_47_14]|uniref:Small ribosomal subunit protein uS3 n=1 Tax=Candidatus Magasanikbacteria bacterium RIFCSPHIGHO2_02_FULL_47_14 TaxID=1798680 RepID=A0A1F6LYQ7_9BACT|nr:MAG: 30S ribosomal protein S3 [Candidatus Magasanikbacteria bacterium RIFCSPHIGHO2_02_FULL_47_14]